MPNFKLVLAYDGTDYVGWQRQANGPSVQAAVEEALAAIEQKPVTVHGAGRTDGGVHAIGQVASVRLEAALDGEKWRRALNGLLPADIRVLSVEDMPASFHARFDATGKTYRYRIWNGDLLSPFDRRYAWHVPQPLDLDAMKSAAVAFVGTHDFIAFQASGGTVTTTERSIDFARWTTDPAGRPTPGRLLVFEASGNGFLRYMVRGMVGTMVEVGEGRRPASEVRDVLASGDRARVGATAPASGLFLTEVRYKS